MAEKIITGRIVQKHAVEANWLLATNFTPKQGEIIVYDKDSTYNYERLKIGDGLTNVNSLPFVDDALRVILLEQINAVDGKVDAVSTLVGDTKVSDQINIAAVNNQSDWSVNDEASPSYIKNRLFYKADPTNIELINGTFASTQAGETLYMMQVGAIDADIVDGQECNVVFDSDAYDVTVKTIQYNDTLSYLIAGNAYVLSSIFGPSVENTGEPFCIIFASGNVICYTNNTSAEHTVIVGAYMAQIVTIPHEYLGLNVGNGEGVSSVQEGNGTSASGNAAHAEGAYTVASGTASHAEGQQTNASGNCAHAEGASTTASGAYSHAEGRGTEASTAYAHAEGYQSEASGEYGSHAEGYITTASGDGAHAEGGQTEASGAYSHAEGSHTIASGEHQHVEGKYNIEDTSSQYAHIVGNGSKNGPVRSNAHTLDWSGNAWYSGDVYVGSTSGKNKDDGSKKLATEDCVDGLVGDTSVSEQIAAAQIVYVGPTAPTDPNIKVWINTAEDGTGVVPVLPRLSTISLPVANWTGDASPYSQEVTINTVTSATKIDLQPTVAQIVSLQDQDIALMAENIDGVVTIYSFGGKPSADMTMQVLLTEVSFV